MKKGIYFKEDIVEELAKELGIPEKEVREIVDLNIAYMKKSIIEKPVALVSLPNLTKLRFNLKLGMSSEYTNSDSTSAGAERKRKSNIGKIAILKNLEKSNHTLINFNKPLFERLYKKITHEKARTVYDRMYHYWAAIEKKSNEILKSIR